MPIKGHMTILLTAVAAVAFARMLTVGLPPVAHADAETVANVPLAASLDAAGRFAFSLTCIATPTNNVEVAFGRDANGNGALDVDEIERVAGWDCGRWFVRGENAEDEHSHSATADGTAKVYFVGEILNLYVAAAWLETGIVMDRSANRFTLAHELGHALGLTDIYHEQEGMDAQGRKAMFTLGERANAAKSGYFSSHPWDWGEETGRGFYGRGDTLAATIERLLMHGRVSGWPGDIPDGRVFGMSRSF